MAPGFSRPNCCQLLLCRDSSDFSRAVNAAGRNSWMSGLRNTKSLRQHADDLVRLAAKPKVLADRVIAAAEQPLPEAVRQDDDLLLPELALRVGEELAAKRLRRAARGRTTA